MRPKDYKVIRPRKISFTNAPAMIASAGINDRLFANVKRVSYELKAAQVRINR